MNPLTVTWAPMLYTDVGIKNLKNMIDSGLDNIVNTKWKDTQVTYKTFT